MIRCVSDGEEVHLLPQACCLVTDSTVIQLSSLLPLLPLPDSHPLRWIFRIKTLNELQTASDAELALCDKLLTEEYFPDSLWVMGLRACVLYHSHSRNICLLTC